MGRVTVYIKEILAGIIILLMSSCWIMYPKQSKGASVVSSGTFEQYTRTHRPCVPQLGANTLCNGTQWIPAYYDGRTLAIIFGDISGGKASYHWNEVGILPAPTPTAYTSRFWVNGVRTTPLRQSWKATGHLTGTGTSTTFTPGILGTFSSSRSTSVVVQFTYSATAGYGGKRTITAQLNPSTNRKGETGIQGPPGADATVTEAAVVSVFAATASANPLVLRPSSSGDSKLEVWDTSNNTRMWFDGLGNQYWKMANGDTVVKILTNGSIFVYRYNVKRVEILNDGTFSTYRTNGSTKTFGNYTNGSYYGIEGKPSSNGLCMTRDMTTGIVSYITCGAGGGSPGGSTRSVQYKATASTYGGTFFRYTAVSATQDGLILPQTAKPFTIYNHAKRAIFSILSGGGLVVGG